MQKFDQLETRLSNFEDSKDHERKIMKIHGFAKTCRKGQSGFLHLAQLSPQQDCMETRRSAHQKENHRLSLGLDTTWGISFGFLCFLAVQLALGRDIRFKKKDKCMVELEFSFWHFGLWGFQGWWYSLGTSCERFEVTCCMLKCPRATVDIDILGSPNCRLLSTSWMPHRRQCFRIPYQRPGLKYRKYMIPEMEKLS